MSKTTTTPDGRTILWENITVASDQFAHELREYTAYRDDNAVMADQKFRHDQHFTAMAEPDALQRIGVSPVGRIPAMWATVRSAAILSQRTEPVVIEGPPGSAKQAVFAAMQNFGRTNRGEVRQVSSATLNAGEVKALLRPRDGADAIAFIAADRLSHEVQGAIASECSIQQSAKRPRLYFLTDRPLSSLAESCVFDPVFLQLMGYSRRLIVPSLADHPWDIMPLVVSQLGVTDPDRRIRYISYAAAMFLTEHVWRGDVAQLLDTVSSVVGRLLCSGGTVLTLRSIIEYFRDIAGSVQAPGSQDYSDEDILPGVHHSDPDRPDLQYWIGRFESVEMGEYFYKNCPYRVSFPLTDREYYNGGWGHAAARDGFDSVLRKSRAGNVVCCRLLFDPLRLNRNWQKPSPYWTIRQERVPTRLARFEALGDLICYRQVRLFAPEDKSSKLPGPDAETNFVFSVDRIRADIGQYMSSLLHPYPNTEDGSQSTISADQMANQTSSQYTENSQTSRAVSPNVFARKGDVWTVIFDGIEKDIRHTKGMIYVATLLNNPRRFFPAADLAQAGEVSNPSQEMRGEDGWISQNGLSEVSYDTGYVHDGISRNDPRVRKLGEQLKEAMQVRDEARLNNDKATEGRQSTLISAINDQLHEMIGSEKVRTLRGGYRRPSNDPDSRARVAVGAAITRAVENIAIHHPSLAGFLESTIKPTASRLTYNSEIEWHVTM